MVSLAIARRVAGLYAPQRSVAQVLPLPGSANGRVFELCFADRSTPLVLKLFDPNHAWQLGQETWVYELLRRAGVPVPDVLLTDGSRELIEADWMLMSKLDGVVAVSLDPSLYDAREIYRAIGGTLRSIHAIAFARFGYFDRRGAVSPYLTNPELMRAWFARDLRRFSEAGGPARLRALIERKIGEGESALARCASAVLCHNDLHEANVLVERTPGGWKVTGVIDVGGAVAADPLFDLARTDYWSARGDARKRAGLREGYGAPVRSDQEAAIGIYALHHALELWCWFARASGGRRMLEEITSDLERLAQPA